MNRALAVCVPPTDLKFGEWVRRLIADDAWDLGSPEGIALMQAVLRETYPESTVKPGARTLDGGARPTLVLDVSRDGTADSGVDRAAASYDRAGAAAYRDALSILGATADRSPVIASASFLAVDQDDLSRLPGAERVALELSAIEGLQVAAIAERMQLSMACIHRLLGEGSTSLESGTEPTPAMLLQQWRDAQRGWERMRDGDPARLGQAAMVAHAFVTFQEATGSIPVGHAVLVTDGARRYVAVSSGAAALMGRRTLVGLRVDDVTPEAGRAMLPTIWARFLADRSMAGEYAVDRPGQDPISLAFRADTDRPLPGLQVSHLAPAATVVESSPTVTVRPLEDDEVAMRPAPLRQMLGAAS